MAQVGTRLKQALSEQSSGRRAYDGVGELFEAMRLLDRVSDGIQHGMMNMRMLPIGPFVRTVPPRDPRYDPRQRQGLHLAVSGESTDSTSG